MARVNVTIYKNSVIATILSVIGTLTLAFSIMGIVLGILGTLIGGGVDSFALAITCLIPALIGFVMMYLASTISDYKRTNQIIKEIREKGIEQQIASSYPLAVQLYNSAPGTRMLNYIQALNPQYAAQIKAAVEEKKKNNKKK